MNWDSPEDRARLIERVGPEEYNRLHEEHMRQSVVEVVNGYPLRYVGSRFGRLVMVGGTTSAFGSLDAARRHAESLPPRPDALQG